jgi:hypothetical protein
MEGRRGAKNWAISPVSHITLRDTRHSPFLKAVFRSNLNKILGKPPALISTVLDLGSSSFSVDDSLHFLTVFWIQIRFDFALMDLDPAAMKLTKVNK